MLRSFGLTIGALTLGGCSSLYHKPETHRRVDASELAREFTPAELTADLHELRRIVDEVHPRPYCRHSSQEVDAIELRLTARIDRPMTRLQFYPIAAELAAAFDDSHTSVQAPFEEWSAFLSSGGRVLPLSLVARGESIVVSHWLSDELGPGPGCILRDVNGIDIAELRERGIKQRAGATAFVTADFANNLSFQLWAAGARSPYVVRAECAGATESFAGIVGSTYFELQQAVSADAPRAKPADWSLYWMDGDIALIDFRSMSDEAAWEDFLEDTFTQIRRRGARGVIVDLRANGGGDANLGVELLSYLVNEPYRMTGRKEWRSSARYRAYLKAHVPAWLRWLPLQYFHPVGRKLWGVDEGEIATLEGDVQEPTSNSLRFDGSWCLLIGPSTFSSAVDLANAVGDYHLAPLFGAETGGVPNDFGEVYSCDLTHTRLQLGVSAAYYVRANGDESDRRGVLPTHEVHPTNDDVKAGRDPVLEAAVRWIRSETGNGS